MLPALARLSVMNKMFISPSLDSWSSVHNEISFPELRATALSAARKSAGLPNATASSAPHPNRRLADLSCRAVGPPTLRNPVLGKGHPVHGFPALCSEAT